MNDMEKFRWAMTSYDDGNDIAEATIIFVVFIIMFIVLSFGINSIINDNNKKATKNNNLKKENKIKKNSKNVIEVTI